MKQNKSTASDLKLISVRIPEALWLEAKSLCLREEGERYRSLTGMVERALRVEIARIKDEELQD